MALGQMFWWVIGKYHQKAFRLGPFRSQEEAEAYGYERVPCSFDTISTDTRDPNRAIRELRKKQLDETGDLGSALQRGRRKAPDEYKTGRW